MFDIGFSEVFLLLVIGLVVLGPKRLPVAIRTVMGWVNTIRNTANRVQAELSQELRLQELREELHKAEQLKLDQLSPELAKTVQELQESAKKMHQELNKNVVEEPKTEEFVPNSVEPKTEPQVNLSQDKSLAENQEKTKAETKEETKVEANSEKSEDKHKSEVSAKLKDQENSNPELEEVDKDAQILAINQNYYPDEDYEALMDTLSSNPVVDKDKQTKINSVNPA